MGGSHPSTRALERRKSKCCHACLLGMHLYSHASPHVMISKLALLLGLLPADFALAAAVVLLLQAC